MSTRLRLAVVGASGRMGRAVVRLAHEAAEIETVCAVAATDVGRDAGELAGVGATGLVVTDRVDAVLAARAEVCVDFSAPPATRALAELAAGAGVAVVSGTTGLDAAATEALEAASARVAVLWEPNMSLGVYVLGELVRRAIGMLGSGFDVEIVEAHHRMKVDAPSGTALRLAHVARQARAGERPKGDIGVLALRGGDVIGDHTVHLLGPGERLELTHRATSRDLFARGALAAARVIAKKPAGRYTLADVVGGTLACGEGQAP